MAEKILIADDEPNILMLTSIMLEDAGYETIMAKNGTQAIERALKDKPDLIITDIVMPEKDGFEVCKTLRANKNFTNVPIIILSAIGDEFNKITGFEGGADDYITKPFNLEELRSRVQTLLLRSKGQKEAAAHSVAAEKKSVEVPDMEHIDTGVLELNNILKGGFPKGSNILLIGPIGSGKSSIARKFISRGIMNKERNIYITLDDSPQMIRKKLDEMVNKKIEEFEELNLFSIVDAYSWSSGASMKKEKYSINGILDLNQLSMVIADAGQNLGQSIQSKLGGRRVIDSISSLLINFDLSIVQRFLSQLARTSLAFGMVNTLFVLEEGTVGDHILNNIKYIMDGVIETKQVDREYYLRVASMKWIDYDRDWIKVKIHD
ncbi:MAG: response regulator [Candidatus Margulisbacteria bacterium]|nr:response regulator [Candidatus Margulisiibacteriota bacterium]